MNPFLKDLIADWFKTDKQLGHFYIKQLTTDWIYCQCIDHAWSEHPAFQVRNDCVLVGQQWDKDIELSAADPNFLPKLKAYLIKCCHHTKCNHDPFVECPL